MKIGTLLASFLVFGGCATATTNTKDKFEQVSLGASRADVEKIYGHGEMQSYESYREWPNIPFKVMVFGTGEKEISFTFDSSGDRLLGKSKSLPKQRIFKFGARTVNLDDPAFKRMRPCHMWSDEDALLMNPENGVFITVSKSPEILVAEEAPELMQFRIDGLYKMCPHVQPPRSK